MTAELASQPLTRSRAGARHLLGCQPIAALARDARLVGIASEWLGAAGIPFKATLFEKTSDANWLVSWHQDTALPMLAPIDVADFGPWSDKEGVAYAHAPARILDEIIALRVHLDESNASNGPLRVLPGTQNLGVLGKTRIRTIAEHATPVECTVGAGGVVVMRPLIVHASSKARHDAPRRVLHFEYAASLDLESGLRLRVA